jgi:hypothetical protein
MSEELIDPTFLFQFSLPLKRWEAKGKTAPAAALGDEYGMPPLGQLAGHRQFADVRLGWNPAGLMLDLRVTGKSQLPWCRDGRIDESDGIRLLIDTRPAPDQHRATRYCQQFALMPLGGGPRRDQPMASTMPIARARQMPPPTSAATIELSSELNRGGYQLRAWFPSKVLHGFDPQEHPQIGCCYAVLDRELGWQSLWLSNDFPLLEDPSLWPRWELVAD